MATDPITQQLLGNLGPNNAYVKALIQGGLDMAPIQSPWQGAARMAQALLAGLELRNEDQKQEALKSATQRLVDSSLGGGGGAAMPGPTASVTPGAAEPTPVDYSQRIAGIESGGNYNAVGPDTGKGDRAYGKYQVLGSNVGPWTKQYTGQELTPQQFLTNPAAQDKVFNGQFGGYVNKYGPEGAARAWFAGEGGMNNPNAKDVLGTTVQQYGQRFAQAGQPMPAGTPGTQAGTPQLSPQQRADFSVVMQQNPALGYELFKKYNTPKEQYRPATEQERASYKVPAGVPAQIDTATGKLTISQPPVSIQNQAENAQEKAMGEYYGGLYKDIQTQGRKARQTSTTLTQLDQLARDPNFYSGAAGEPVKWLKQAISALGGDPKLAASTENFAGLSNKLVYDTLGSLGNQISNSDRTFIQNVFPSLGLTKEGNIARITIMQKLYERQAQIADMARHYKNGRLDPEFENQADAVANKPLFSDQEMKAIISTPQGQSQMQTQPQQTAPSSDDLVERYRSR